MKRFLLLIFLLITSQAKAQFTCLNMAADVPTFIQYDTVVTQSVFDFMLRSQRILRFKPKCTSTSIMEITKGCGPVGIKISNGNCTNTGYTLVIPYYIQSWPLSDKYFYYLNMDSSYTYDLILETVPNYSHYVTIHSPDVINFRSHDITPDAITFEWGNTLDEVIIDYGKETKIGTSFPTPYYPGTDTTPGVGGTVIRNAVSPLTIYNLEPNTVYNFYIRTKCNTYSNNSAKYRIKTPVICDSVYTLHCNEIFGNSNYPDNLSSPGSWNANECGMNDPVTSPERILKIIPDTTGYFTLHKNAVGGTFPAIQHLYKEASLGCNEKGWKCIGASGYNGVCAWKFGPLLAGVPYYLLINSTQGSIGGAGVTSTGYRLDCPTNCYTPWKSIFYQRTNTTVTIKLSCPSTVCNPTNVLLEYGPIGFTPGKDSLPGIGGTVIYNLTFPYVLDSLIPGQGYDYYMRQYCDTSQAFSSNTEASRFFTFPVCSVDADSIGSPDGNTICEGDSITIYQYWGQLSMTGKFNWSTDSCYLNFPGYYSSIRVAPVTTTTYYFRIEDSCAVSQCKSFTVYVKNKSINNIDTSACTDFTLNNIAYNSSGDFVQHFTNAIGCDSIINLHLEIRNNDTTLVETACDSYLMNNIIYDSSGTYFQTLTNNFGCDSLIRLDLAILKSSTSAIDTTVCYSVNINGVIYTNSGNFNQVLFNSSGCDSTIDVTVNITSEPPVIIQNGNVLAVMNMNISSYQWIDCNNSSAIQGEDQSVFTASLNGNYAVVLNNNGCIDTSDCYSITNVGLYNIENSQSFNVYPNPASDKLFITNKTLTGEFEINVLNVLSQSVYQSTIKKEIIIDTKNFKRGIYYISLSDKNSKQIFTQKIILE